MRHRVSGRHSFPWRSLRPSRWSAACCPPQTVRFRAPFSAPVREDLTAHRLPQSSNSKPHPPSSWYPRNKTSDLRCPLAAASRAGSLRGNIPSNAAHHHYRRARSTIPTGSLFAALLAFAAQIWEPLSLISGSRLVLAPGLEAALAALSPAPRPCPQPLEPAPPLPAPLLHRLSAPRFLAS